MRPGPTSETPYAITILLACWRPFGGAKTFGDDMLAGPLRAGFPHGHLARESSGICLLLSPAARAQG